MLSFVIFVYTNFLVVEAILFSISCYIGYYQNLSDNIKYTHAILAFFILAIFIILIILSKKGSNNSQSFKCNLIGVIYFIVNQGILI